MTEGLPHVVDSVTEHSTEFLQLAISLGSGGLYPWCLPRAINQHRGFTRYPRIIECSLNQGDVMWRGVRRNAGRVVIPSWKVIIRGGGGPGALAMLPSKGDAKSDERCRSFH
jgi:hypothetical protein